MFNKLFAIFAIALICLMSFGFIAAQDYESNYSYTSLGVDRVDTYFGQNTLKLEAHGFWNLPIESYVQTTTGQLSTGCQNFTTTDKLATIESFTLSDGSVNCLSGTVGDIFSDITKNRTNVPIIISNKDILPIKFNTTDVKRVDICTAYLQDGVSTKYKSVTGSGKLRIWSNQGNHPYAEVFFTKDDSVLGKCFAMDFNFPAGQYLTQIDVVYFSAISGEGYPTIHSLIVNKTASEVTTVAPVTTSDCTDSDGKNLFVKGTTTGWDYYDTKKITSSDFCAKEDSGAETETGAYVAEELCDAANKVHSYYYACPSGTQCSDGACKSNATATSNTNPVVFSVGVNNYPDTKDYSQTKNIDGWVNMYAVTPVASGVYKGALIDTEQATSLNGAKFSVNYGQIVDFVGFKTQTNAQNATAWTFSAPPYKHFGKVGELCQTNFLDTENPLMSNGAPSCATSLGTPYQDGTTIKINADILKNVKAINPDTLKYNAIESNKNIDAIRDNVISTNNSGNDLEARVTNLEARVSKLEMLLGDLMNKLNNLTSNSSDSSNTGSTPDSTTTVANTSVTTATGVINNVPNVTATSNIVIPVETSPATAKEISDEIKNIKQINPGDFPGNPCELVSDNQLLCNATTIMCINNCMFTKTDDQIYIKNVDGTSTPVKYLPELASAIDNKIKQVELSYSNKNYSVDYLKERNNFITRLILPRVDKTMQIPVTTINPE